MSLAIEGLQKVAQHIAESLHDLKRGYSDAELENEKRLAFGQLTSADRDMFKRDRAKKLGLAMQVFRETPGYDPGDISLIPMVLLFHEEMERLATLPDPELDERIKADAQNRLKSWEQLG